MSKLGRICAIAAIISLAGCASQPTSKRAQVSDWESERHPNASRYAGATEPRAPEPLPPVLPAPATDNHETWISLTRWCKANDLGSPRLISNSIPLEFEVHATNGLFSFRIGERTVRWEGIELRLGFAPVLIDSRPFIHTLDL